MNAEQTNNLTQPQITAPKGGGAITGINEQFQSDTFTGAAGFSIPVPLTAARGLEPALSVNYSSGAPNGTCGMGASLSVSMITRKTSNGIPQYNDADVFLADGAELVPKLKFDKAARQWQPVTRRQDDCLVTVYSPRVEGTFNLIEHWQYTRAEGSFWVITSKNNQQTIYGLSPQARMADPDKPRRIFSWLREAERDATGNVIDYTYELDGQDNYPYLKSIDYGNYVTDGSSSFAFKVVIDYGTFNPARPEVMPAGYRQRPDPFSSFVSGFEIRNSRLVHHVLLYHQLAGQYNGEPFLVKALALMYGGTGKDQENAEPLSGLSFLQSLTVVGYQIQDDCSYLHKALPPVELTYLPFSPAAHHYRVLKVEEGYSIPGYLSGGSFQLFDLNSDGLPGLLYSGDDTSLYYAPQGDGTYDAPVLLEQFPNARNLRTGENMLTSLFGNGVNDMVVEKEGQSGYYKNTGGGEWAGFEPFPFQATEAFAAGKQYVDITGDGLADLVLFEQDAIKYYRSLGTGGYSAAAQVLLNEDFPAVDNNDEQELLTFTGMLGDGLQHYVRIRNGSVECWPSLGYGHFGAARVLRNAPYIAGGLDVSRLRLADIDGSGTADFVYLEHDHVKIWFNQCGNGFSSPVEIPLPVAYDQLSQLNFADINGTGTNCMIITVTDPEVRHYYYDFCGREKPYLLQTTKNNMGASAAYSYSTSVKQYLRDKSNGRPWPTKLFFPVHVVSAVKTMDQPSGACHIQRYAYHDGYYDPVERTFRGFGFIESWDTDHFEAYSAAASRTGFPVNTINRELHVPPVYTKIWYHTGVYNEAGKAAAFYRQEYFKGDPFFFSIAGQVLDAAIKAADADTLRQAYTAMEGQLLRQEVYGLDGTGAAQNPYTVSETEIAVRLLQPKEDQRYAVFLHYTRQSMAWNYERNPSDPRVTHNVSLRVDEWGNADRSCNIYYPRRAQAEAFVFAEQKELKITVGCASFVSQPEPLDYYISIPVENTAYEVEGITVPPAGYFTFSEIEKDINAALQQPLAYHTPFPPGGTAPVSRLYSWVQHYYQDNARQTALPLGIIDTPLLLNHTETAVYPQTAFDNCYEGLLSAGDIASDTGYIIRDNYYWNAGLSQYYLPAGQYYLPSVQQNDFAPAGNLSLQPVSSLFYDDYFLRPVTSTVELTGTAGITVTSLLDYRTMQSWQVTDPNGNISEVLFDPLGYVLLSTQYGTIGETSFGNMPAASYRPCGGTAAEVISNPQRYLQQMGSYFYYDTFAWMDRSEPVCAITLQAQLYASQVKDSEVNPIKIGLAFSDGLGRALLSKTNTTPGSLGVRNRDGNWIYTSLKDENNWSDDRWICLGHTIYNNKGDVSQQFQPYFADGWDYQPPNELISSKQLTPPSILHYDALSRLIRTDSPKGFFSKTIFTPWGSKKFDANDTILDSPYYLRHQEQLDKIKSGTPDAGDYLPKTGLDAIKQAIACYNSPAAGFYDTMGRNIRGVVDNLGMITAAKLLPVLGSDDAVQTALTQLLAAGWLIVDNNDPAAFWLTDTFQPYTNGFAAAFTVGGASSAALLNLLKQGRLTTWQVYDIQGRTLQSVDPRLLWSDLTAGTGYFNFRYLYTMTGGVVKTESADAGLRTRLSNMFAGQLQYWDARGTHTVTTYDQLQRVIRTEVSGGDGEFTGTRVAELVIFGETAPDAAANNLVGQPWKVFDDAGLLLTSLCNIAGAALMQQRYFRHDYKIGADWTGNAQTEVMKEKPFSQFSDQNAFGQAIRNVSPDGSVYLPVYNTAGQLARVQMLFADNAGTTPAPVTIVQQVVYDPGGQSVYLEYGNGTAIRKTIEATTQNVIQLRSFRLNKPKKDAPLQEIHYTYDPVGNVTARRDNSWENVFNQNQLVEPLSQYAYNLIYQLVNATGRELNPQTAGGTERKLMQEYGIPISWANPNDSQALQNYSEDYSYDDAGNLTRSKHSGAKQWTWNYNVADDCNRLAANGLKTVSYDANGNMTDLAHLSSITWSYSDRLERAVMIARTDADPDAEYYQYDSGGNRVRKVTELLIQGGTKKEIQEKYYWGGYEYKRIIHVAVTGGKSKPEPVVLLEKQTHKVGIPGSLCCIVHNWLVDKSGRETVDLQPVYRYQYNDVLNSVGVETNKNGQLISYEEYYPYGGTSFTASAKVLEVATKEYRYCGHEKDGFTGLYYYGMRYYPPWLCRWMNTDPAGTIDGLNLYAFVGGNPVTHYDIGGMCGGGKRKAEEQGEQSKKKTKYYLNHPIVPEDIPSSKKIAKGFTALGEKIGREIKSSASGGITKYLKMYTSMQEGEGNFNDLVVTNNNEQDDFTIGEAFKLAAKPGNRSSDFAGFYRAAHTGQDEHLSCLSIYHLLNGALSTGLNEAQTDELRETFRLVSRFRLPTMLTGVNTGEENTNMQHSMGSSDFRGYFATESNSGSSQHNYWDRHRAHVALQEGEKTTEDGIGRFLFTAVSALGYTLASAYPRTTGSNIVLSEEIDDDVSAADHDLRERAKKTYFNFFHGNVPLKPTDAQLTDVCIQSFNGNCPSPVYRPSSK